MYDMMDMAREINESMARSYDVPEGLDESDLMAELDGLEEDLGAEALGEGDVPSYMQEQPLDELPAAPQNEQGGGKEQEQAPALRS